MTLGAKIGVAFLGLLAAGAMAVGVTLSHDSACGTQATGTAAGMKAIAYHCYGSPDVLHVETLARPVPADHELLVRVHAASINPLEWHYMRGTPYIMRMQVGIGAPKDARLGVDFAGTVESVGNGVTAFKPGDPVFGGADGALAEFVTVRETDAIVAKPANLSFEQAATVPIAAVTALQGLRDKGALRPGQKVLVNGASGGVGTFAVQVAKALGAEVTGVCSTRNVGLVRSLGADHVIDYTSEDYTRSGQRYDLILDTVGNHTLLENRRALTAEGRFLIIGGPKGNWLGPLAAPIKAKFLSPFISQHFEMFIADLTRADLTALAGLMQAGKVVPVIDRRYPLEQVPEAMRYIEEGHARGKVVIDIDSLAGAR